MLYGVECREYGRVFFGLDSCSISHDRVSGGKMAMLVGDLQPGRSLAGPSYCERYSTTGATKIIA